MYRLLEYFKDCGEIKQHLVYFSDSKEEIDKTKNEIAESLQEMDITAYEVIYSKNIDNLNKLLERDDIKIFQVIHN